MSTTASGSGHEVDSPKRVMAFGIAAFAGLLLTVVSVLQILQGIAAIANDKVLRPRAQLHLRVRRHRPGAGST